MKKKILKISAYTLITLIAVTSLFFNVVLGVSSNFTFSNKDNYELRYEIYNTTAGKLYLLENDALITMNMLRDASEQEGGKYVKETIQCKYNKASLISSCIMQASIYDEDMNTLKNTYLPGDGYKYEEIGESKNKSIYNNNSLLSYAFYSFYNYFYQYGSILVSEDENMSFETEQNFSFKAFNFNKVITVTNNSTEENVYISKYELFVDSSNIVNKIVFNDSITMEMSYNSDEVLFPDLTKFGN